MATVIVDEHRALDSRQVSRTFDELADLLVCGAEIAANKGVTVTRDLVLRTAGNYRLANAIGLMLMATYGGFSPAMEALCFVAPQCCGGGDCNPHAPDLQEAAAVLLSTSPLVICNIHNLYDRAEWSLKHIEQAIRSGVVARAKEEVAN